MWSGQNRPHRRINIVVSAWVCIAFGTGAILSNPSDFSLYLAATLSLGGLVVLLFGLSMPNDSIEDETRTRKWTPELSTMPDAGRPMFRIDTTLDSPTITTVLCGRCAHLEEIDGKKPTNFTCPSCQTELWSSEEE